MMLLLACCCTATEKALTEQAPPAEVVFNEHSTNSSFFSSYSRPGDHIHMLLDEPRMRAYFDAIKLNAGAHFRGKVVLDVGCGTGVLSVWAAKMGGAARVYCCEASSVAVAARALAEDNGVSDVVQVISAKIEDVELAEGVDVIISEWMGYALLWENMLLPVLHARDRWLKPGGVMYPSSARIFVAPQLDVSSDLRRQAEEDVRQDTVIWQHVENYVSQYGLRVGANLRSLVHDDTMARHARTMIVVQVGTSYGDKLGGPAELLYFDLHDVTAAQIYGFRHQVALAGPSEASPMRQLVVWFSTYFCADSSASPRGACVELSTAPAALQTHWKQAVLPLNPAIVAPSLSFQFDAVDAGNSARLNLTLFYSTAKGEVAASYSRYREFDREFDFNFKKPVG